MSELKILHRIYFGFDGKPDLYSEYLKTWEEQLPEYKIMHWNADNLPMDINEFVQKMYESREHAFLSDYFRWWVLKEHGGVYLDADVEIVNGKLFNEIIEEFESSDNHSLIGVDTDDGWYTAHSMACKKNSPLAELMCDIYGNMGYFYHWRKTSCTAPILVTLYFLERTAQLKTRLPFLDNIGRTNPKTIIDIEGVRILPQDYMSPLKYFDVEGGSVFYLRDYDPSKTIICHHYGCSWHTPDSPYYSKFEDTLESRKMLDDYKNIELSKIDEEVSQTEEVKPQGIKQKIKQRIVDKNLELEFNQLKGNVVFHFMVDFYRFIKFWIKVLF